MSNCLILNTLRLMSISVEAATQKNKLIIQIKPSKVSRETFCRYVITSSTRMKMTQNLPPNKLLLPAEYIFCSTQIFGNLCVCNITLTLS